MYMALIDIGPNLKDLIVNVINTVAVVLMVWFAFKMSTSRDRQVR